MLIHVLGVGMGRTGTHSLKLALEKLGFGPCYHMIELINRPSDIRYWKELDQTGQTDWKALFGRYQSAVDFPAVAYYRQILKKYPAAKVILTERDEESWYQSARQTIMEAEPGFWEKVKMSLLLPFSARQRKLIQVFQFSGKFWEEEVGKDYKNKDTAIAFYRRWNQRIKDEILGEQLLVYQVRDGWEPLCAFLDVEVPDEPFPQSNTRREFQARKKQIMNR